ncbi:MAG: hypothetical protein AAGK21_07360 [Bacteroidota bacterium]
MRPLRPLLLALLALTISACEDEVDPTLNEDLPYSMYGYLDPTLDQQALRVVPITATLRDSVFVDATVTSTDLGTGAVTSWRDTVVTFTNGTRGTIFVADYTPTPGTRIRIEATSPDGDVSSAETAIPPIIAPAVGVAEFSLGEVRYPIRYEGAPRLLAGSFRLIVDRVPGLASGATRTVLVRLDEAPEETSPGVWTARIPFVSSVRRALTEQGLLGSRLLSAQYVGFVVDDNWNPPSLDPDALVEPGTFSNVDGGLGFIGAGYRSVASWVPSPNVQVSSGFSTDQEAASFIALNEVRTGTSAWVELYNPLFSPVRMEGYSLSEDRQEPRKQTLPFEVLVPAQGYTVVPLEFSLREGQTLGLYNRAGDQLRRLFVEATKPGQTHGSFPDGLSFRLPQGGPDIFQGSLIPTPGEANRIDGQAAYINELYTEGTDGFVEAAAASGFQVQRLQAFSDPRGYFRAIDVAGSGSFAIAPETPGGLELPQVSGDVFLVAFYSDSGEGGQLIRVVDARTYGGQTPGRSSGYLPDGPSGTWRTDLVPTPAASNESSRRAF